MSGDIKDVRLYDVALTLEEIIDLFNTYNIETTPDGVIAHWKLDEMRFETAKDELGISDGTLYNMGGLWVPGKVGNCLDFSGGSDSSYVGVPNNDNIDIDSTISFSISALVTTTDINVSTDQNVLFKGYTSNDVDGHWYGIIFKNNELRLAIDDKVAKSQLALENAHEKMYLDGEAWNHIVGVRDMSKDTLFIYLNGSKVASMEDLTELNISTPLPLIIGNNPDHSNNFEGKIDDVIMFNRALSMEEIAEMTGSYGIEELLSSNAKLASLEVNGTPIPGFIDTVTTYLYGIPENDPLPVITATAAGINATVDIVDATAVPGSGTVTVTAEDNSQLVYTVNFVYGSGVSDVYTSSGLNMYPNPASKQLFIVNESEISSITIYSTIGAVMNLYQDVNSKSFILDLDKFDNGLYLIRVVSVNGDIISKTFMKK
jgi:hypothetical protein